MWSPTFRTSSRCSRAAQYSPRGLTRRSRKIRACSKRMLVPPIQQKRMVNAELLRVTDLHAFYGESHILHGIDFTVNRGEVVTLLGRNGAGRTTTLRAMLGLT